MKTQTPVAATATPSPISAANQALMVEHGITCAPVDQYHIGTYKYGSLDEAVAQAKRQAAQPGDKNASSKSSGGTPATSVNPGAPNVSDSKPGSARN